MKVRVIVRMGVYCAWAHADFKIRLVRIIAKNPKSKQLGTNIGPKTDPSFDIIG